MGSWSGEITLNPQLAALVEELRTSLDTFLGHEATTEQAIAYALWKYFQGTNGEPVKKHRKKPFEGELPREVDTIEAAVSDVQALGLDANYLIAPWCRSNASGKVAEGKQIRILRGYVELAKEFDREAVHYAADSIFEAGKAFKRVEGGLRYAKACCKTSLNARREKEKNQRLFYQERGNAPGAKTIRQWQQEEERWNGLSEVEQLEEQLKRAKWAVEHRYREADPELVHRLERELAGARDRARKPVQQLIGGLERGMRLPAHPPRDRRRPRQPEKPAADRGAQEERRRPLPGR